MTADAPLHLDFILKSIERDLGYQPIALELGEELYDALLLAVRERACYPASVELTRFMGLKITKNKYLEPWTCIPIYGYFDVFP